MKYAGRSKQPAPHLPIWKQDGAVVIERYTESFVDRNGNKAVLFMVCWKDKKDRFFVKHRKELLSGPWSTHEQAVLSRSEWMVPNFGGFVKRGVLTSEEMQLL